MSPVAGAPIASPGPIVVVLVAGTLAMGGWGRRRRDDAAGDDEARLISARLRDYQRTPLGPVEPDPETLAYVRELRAAHVGDRGAGRAQDAAVVRAETPVPPDAGSPWTAEITWSQVEGQWRFGVAARRVGGEAGPVALMHSEPLAWPPRDERSLEELKAAVASLEEAMLAAGWRAVDRGPSWYAKRFDWTPEPVATTPDPAIREGSRFRRGRRAPASGDTGP